MAYIIDIAIVLAFGFIIFFSVKKGFVMSAFELLGTVVSFLFSKALSENLAGPIFEKYLSSTARQLLSDRLGEIGSVSYEAEIEKVISSIPDSFQNLMEVMGINRELILEKASSSNLSGKNLIDFLMNEVVEPIGTSILKFVLLALSLVVISIALKFIVKLISKIIKKLPVLGKMDSALGGVLGAIKGVLVVVIISFALLAAASFVKNESFLLSVESSKIISLVQKTITGLNSFKV